MNATLTRTTIQPITHHHGLFGRLLQVLLTWQERAHQRHALALLGNRDLNDLGLSRADVAYETDKPFWRG